MKFENLIILGYIQWISRWWGTELFWIPPAVYACAVGGENDRFLLCIPMGTIFGALGEGVFARFIYGFRPHAEDFLTPDVFGDKIKKIVIISQIYQILSRREGMIG
ncbi:MAG TPA: hypothetical protein IGS52_14785 [Oscillatoriaceae cyanobacterium M33_DOE_052]|nr:hypothetical protein [Oscillatoriaceae cyanobacterium M33_DOE_052]